MEEINSHNYEAFLLDYSEGNLNEEEIIFLKNFILNNPSLNIQLENCDLVYLEEDENEFDIKNELIKDENAIRILNYIENELSVEDKNKFKDELVVNPLLAEHLNELKKTILKPDLTLRFENKELIKKENDNLLLNNTLLNYFENLQNQNQRLEFEIEIKKNNLLKKEIELLQKTKLVADTSILYPNKNELIKENKTIILFSFKDYTAMAAAILLLIGLTILFNYYIPDSVPNSKYAIIRDTLFKKINDASSKTKYAPPLKPIKTYDLKNKNLANLKLNNRKIAISTKGILINKIKNFNFIKTGVNKLTNYENLKDSIFLIQRVNTPKIELVSNDTLKNNDKINNVTTNKIETYIKQTVLVEEIDSDNSEENNSSDSFSTQKISFWKRAVSLVKQAKRLGITNINAEEKNKDNFIIAFNSISIEKK